MLTLSSRPIRRADVFAYLTALLCLPLWGFDWTSSAFGLGVDTLARVVLGGFAILAGISMYRNPAEVTDGSDPASRALLALAGLGTLAAGFLVVSAV